MKKEEKGVTQKGLMQEGGGVNLEIGKKEEGGKVDMHKINGGEGILVYDSLL